MMTKSFFFGVMAKNHGQFPITIFPFCIMRYATKKSTTHPRIWKNVNPLTVKDTSALYLSIVNADDKQREDKG